MFAFFVLKRATGSKDLIHCNNPFIRGLRENTLLNYNTYLHESSRTWVTFVHGAGGSSAIWHKQIREFKNHFNVLLLDLRGHGDSKPSFKDAFNERYDFDSITNDIVEVIDHLEIIKSHFVGISLGTVLIRNLAEKYPARVESMVLGGAILKLDFKFRMLLGLSAIFKSVVPYIWLYKLFTFAIMPDSNHKESRLLLVREAKKLYQKEFIRWFKLSADINPLLRLFRAADIGIPTLYVMGGEDHLFLPSVRRMVEQHSKSSLLLIEHCGHVVNVEQSQLFNNFVIGYVSDLN
ncbi:Pimeloyl-ACP methyl ester carboxylesterase [Kriegella aquimaris]|uniref:Pimeloyl-ACP methyl ester carboxylesterase n=1 Tax=Kriegella aquimaris TaxID=192904 RepID=A0A1G9XIA8_9FLAO|nr:Pimeloyl-ACP methyl ester carboxylesterase [Kriegella aquimaris]